MSSHVADFNARNTSLTAKLLQQGYRYHKLRKTFSKFYRRHYELVSKFNVGLKTLLHQGLSEPEFYGDLLYKLKKKNVGRADFSNQFRKNIVRYKRIGYNINIMRQSASLVFNPITVNNFPSLFNCTPVGRASDSMLWHKAIYFSWLGPELFCLLLGPPGFNCWFSFAPVFQWCCSTPQGSPVSVTTRCFCRVLIFVSSQYLSVIYLFPVMIHWWVRKTSRGTNNYMFWAMT